LPANKAPFEIDGQLRQYIESRYSPIPRDDQEKLIDALVGLTEFGRDKKQTLHAFLEQAARVIFRFFAFNEIIIGLYDRKQKDFYHETVFGYRSDIAGELKKLRYNLQDMVGQDRFPFIKIGKISEIDPVEGLPEDERQLFNRPYAGSIARKELDEFHEGDYIDVWMYDSRKNIIGWLEISAPRTGKLPPRIAVMWAEVIASICASVVRYRWLLEDRATG
jgi:hypothetical protein